MSKNVVLIGFMGTGKTTIGKIIAQKINYDFIDTDRYIEEKFNISIKGIFESYGEEYFRELEKRAIEEISSREFSVISTGGGVILNNDNIINLKEKGIIFLLNGSVETIVNNLSNSRNKRPLLSENNWTEKLVCLLEKRKNMYISSADYIIDINDKSLNMLAQEIINHFN
ncbi:shikimate kinase [Sporosalibacterium faouarense]|uniref:shikimate kinase n=1 Tax=Sporosalibacterium faouarense TaxID=516123 RepID=UPI00141C1440|nr:shikimate kinase [Sporosalibacterium faouarense]MTI48207.1 shikimate kinase [Bacillota bacterium]